ncbi:hypothetical protein Pan44_16340 [Caulifigura coniformis]|uniref:DUF1080 domain-containing protein n=1 Tax=Caulifigura coniformis TaxID=2527983 RepID=A0A517SBV6_9PLAN|nr:hypothetical protein [Caulifigura coniformis]QDT53611.1 hypothetical protein Pan44_16340 [Caulifigura coniformis]
MLLLRRCVAILAFPLFAASIVSADDVLRPISQVWTFDLDTGGAGPAGFRTAIGTWVVANDGPGKVLQQTATSADSVFNLILRPDTLLENLEVSVRLKASAGVVDQGGGIVWRAKNAKTYYVARFNPLEDSFRVYKVVDGVRSQLGSVKVPGDKEWHTLRVTMNGASIVCTLDGAHEMAVEDQSIRGYGRVGLWSKADAQSSFDDFKASGTGYLVPPPAPPAETKEFEIRNQRAFLGGQEIDLWGLRCGNAFYSDAVTERFVRNFDNMNAHGINMVAAFIQGVNAGFPDGDAGFNGYSRHGKLLPETVRRIEFFVREADKRGMVVMLGCITPRKDQDFYDEADMQVALEETAKFLKEKKLRNVFVNLCDEFNHVQRADQPLTREPDGAAKKAKMQGWFKAINPDVECGVGAHWKADTGVTYPGMDVCIIQKGAAIPKEGWVINAEPIREDDFNNDGIFNATHKEAIFRNCRNYLDAPHAVFMFHSGHVQGITNYSGTAPHGEMGGYGTSQYDRGIRFYYDWVRDNVGRWEYPRHLPSAEFSIDAGSP